jgi:hypothetical protein
MYLYARRYCSAYTDPEVFDKLTQVEGLAFPAPEAFDVRAQVGYWRKANAIHGWFVRHCAGEDEERALSGVHVDTDDLKALRDLCLVLCKNRDAERALEELPPQEGFFFGSAEIGEWYWDDLDDTVKQLNGILTWDEVRAAALGREYSGVDYIYEASW